MFFKKIYFFIVFTFSFLGAGEPLIEVGTKLPDKEATIVGDVAGNFPIHVVSNKDGSFSIVFNDAHSGEFTARIQNAEFQEISFRLDDGIQIDLFDEDLTYTTSSPVTPYQNIPFHSRDSFQVKHVFSGSDGVKTTFSLSHLKKSYCPDKKALLSPFRYVGWGLWDYEQKTPYYSPWGKGYDYDTRSGLIAFGSNPSLFDESFLEYPSDYKGPAFSYKPYDKQLPSEGVGEASLFVDLNEGTIAGIIELGSGQQIELVNGRIDLQMLGMPFFADIMINGEQTVGQVRGRFYGPAGEEIAGVFLLDDEADDSITGVFAAHE